MKLPIYLYGSEVLRRPAEEADLNDREGLTALLEDMKETLRSADGCGLAAPQVGQSIQVVVIDVGEGLIELVNPEIVRMEGSETDTEGCLSVPEIYGDVERAAKVSVKYLNRQGKHHRITATGLLARCLQHEIDHLHGRLFIDIAQNLHKVTK